MHNTKASHLGWLHGLADPVRLEIFTLLVPGDALTVTDLLGRCASSGTTMRRHLEVMVTAGLVKVEVAESDGETQGRPATRFYLAEEVRENVSGMISNQVRL